MYNSPAEMIRDLAGMPLTVLMALFYADRLPMSETAVGEAVLCSGRTARKWLIVLQGKQLVFKERRYDGWGLTRPATQLKMRFLIGDGNGKSFPSNGNSFPSNGNSFPSNGNSFPSNGNSFPSNGNSFPSQAPFYIDRSLDRQIDREDVFLPPHNVVSLNFLKKLGITGNLTAMAWADPDEVLAAWWECQWGNDVPALLSKHLLDKKPIDETYTSLASWRLTAGADDIELLESLLGSHGRSWQPDISELPKGVTVPMYKAAVKVYQKLGGLPLG
jgi:hypothetical protein